MKLGKGNKIYKFKFKYIETGRIAIKNVYAETIEEAKKLFDEEYKNYKIEKINIEEKKQ